MDRPNRALVVEVEPSGLTWRKSSASSGNGGTCVEMAFVSASVLVRDSKNRQGPRLPFSAPSWTAFVSHLPAHGSTAA